MLNRHLLFLYGAGLLICTAVGCGLFGNEGRWGGACADELNATEAGKTVSRQTDSPPTPCSAWVEMQRYSFTFWEQGEDKVRLSGPARPMFGWAKTGVDCPVKACGAIPLRNQISHVETWEVVNRTPKRIFYLGEDSRGMFQHIVLNLETGLPVEVRTSRTGRGVEALYIATFSEFERQPLTATRAPEPSVTPAPTATKVRPIPTPVPIIIELVIPTVAPSPRPIPVVKPTPKPFKITPVFSTPVPTRELVIVTSTPMPQIIVESRVERPTATPVIVLIPPSTPTPWLVDIVLPTPVPTIDVVIPTWTPMPQITVVRGVERPTATPVDAPVPTNVPTATLTPTATTTQTATHTVMSASTATPTPAATPEPTATHTPTPVPTYSTAEIQRYMLGLINNERERAGLDPVVLGTNDAAQRHADASLAGCFSSHWDLNGLNPWMRYHRAGGYQWMGENALGLNFCIVEADGYAAIRGVKQKVASGMDSWMDSPGHRRTILRPWAKKVNIGITWDRHNFVAYQQFEGVHVEFSQLPSIEERHPDSRRHRS